MSEPWTASLAMKVLAGMSDHSLATVTPADFQRYPQPRVLPAEIGRELISNERARRARNKGETR